MLNKGFTLIELMVVLVVIGLFSSLVLLTVSPNANKQLEQEAKRLFRVIELAQDEAVMQGVELGLTIKSQDYFFSILSEKKWLRLTTDRQFLAHTFESSLVVKLNVEGEFLDNDTDLPAIMMLSSGELTPFKLSLFREQQPSNEYLIVGQENGQLSMTHSDD